MGARQAGELVSRYLEQSGLTQATVAHELGQRLGYTVRQNQVSAHKSGNGWGTDPGPLAAAYVDVLKIPADDMLEAWGFGDAEKKRPRPATLADLVKDDPSLTPAAKKHLIQQYGLLQLASKQERSGHPVLENPTRSGRSAAR